MCCLLNCVGCYRFCSINPQNVLHRFSFSFIADGKYNLPRQRKTGGDFCERTTTVRGEIPMQEGIELVLGVTPSKYIILIILHILSTTFISFLSTRAYSLPPPKADWESTPNLHPRIPRSEDLTSPIAGHCAQERYPPRYEPAYAFRSSCPERAPLDPRAYAWS